MKVKGKQSREEDRDYWRKYGYHDFRQGDQEKLPERWHVNREPEGRDGVSHVDVWEKEFHAEHSKYKGSEGGAGPG